MNVWNPLRINHVITFILGVICTYYLLKDTSKPSTESLEPPVKKRNWTIFCWITTQPGYHSTRAIHVAKTWAKRCDKYLFMSSQDDPSLPAIAIVEQDRYIDLWRKTSAALLFLDEHFITDFDFFLKADDDTYVVVENLRKVLERYDPTVPILLGYRMKSFFKGGYLTGGAGYVISRSALRKFAKGLKSEPTCKNSKYKWAEDVALAGCAHSLKIPVIHSVGRSEKSHSWPESPIKAIAYQKLTAPFSFLNNKQNTDCCDDNLVSFHHLPPEEIYFLDYMLYTLTSD